MSEIGRCFGRDRTTAAHACRAIEDRRDDPEMEHLLSLLEEALVPCLDSWDRR
jgi:chromosomal replication initiation ATPase DnaA